MNVFNVCASSLLFLAPVVVASDSSPAAPDPWASAGQVAMFLLLTIGLIFLLAWLATKAKAIRPMGGSQVIRPVATLALGVKEKVALVQVGEKQILLGITAQQITPLAEFDEPIVVADETSPTFSEVLKKAVRS